jgi:hypothetical protein
MKLLKILAVVLAAVPVFAQTVPVKVDERLAPIVKGFLVPVEMRESYSDRRGTRVEGTAEYGRFRQFRVNVDEQFLLKK